MFTSIILISNSSLVILIDQRHLPAKFLKSLGRQTENRTESPLAAEFDYRLSLAIRTSVLHMLDDSTVKRSPRREDGKTATGR